MARVLLVFGPPGHGKTTLAEKLRIEHAFHRMSADDVYVEFVRAYFPTFYFAELRNCILQHYDFIFRLDPARRQAWCQHLLNGIILAASNHPKVVVDGYQLYDCKDAIETVLKEASHQVFQLKVEDFGATEVYQGLQPRLTAAEIAGLGDD